MKKPSVMCLVFACAISLAVSAQNLVPSGNIQAADGIFTPGEYAFVGTYAGIKLGLTLSSDGKTLFIAVEAPTTGWLAIGLGSLRMDGAFMVLAFDAGGKGTISEETGTGHTHKPNTVKKLSAAFVKETGKVTVLELALPAAEYLASGSLKAILAYGKADNFNSIHAKRAPVEVPAVKK